MSILCLTGGSWMCLTTASCRQGQDPQNLEPEKCSGWHWHILPEIPEPRFEPLTEVIQVLTSKGQSTQTQRTMPLLPVHNHRS